MKRVKTLAWALALVVPRLIGAVELKPDLNSGTVREITNADFYSAGTISAEAIDTFYQKELPPDKFDMWAGKKDRVYLHGSWKFIKLAGTRFSPDCDYGLKNGFEKPGYDDSQWFNQPVPFLWNYYFTTDFSQYRFIEPVWGGIGWYRREVALPGNLNLQDKRVILHCRMIDHDSVVYVNGDKVSGHKNFQFDSNGADFYCAMNNSYEVDITEHIKAGAANTLAVQVYDDSAHWRMKVSPSSPGKGGIWQEMYLEIRPALYLQQALITPELGKSSIRVQAFIENTLRAEKEVWLHAVVGPWASERYRLAAGKEQTYPIGSFKIKPGKNIVVFEIALENPITWSTENPYLYHFKLTDGAGSVLGQERFGYRDFTVGQHLFKLNGIDLFLMGRQVNFMLNANFSLVELNRNDAAWNFFKIIKSVNHNMVRSHSTFMPEGFYAIADELGLLVYDELSRGYSSNGGGGPLDDFPLFFDLQTGALTLPFKQSIKQRLQLLYNHPCVVIRDGGNEIWDKDLAANTNAAILKYDVTSFTPYLDNIVASFREYDRTRPAAPCSGRAPTDESLAKVGADTWGQVRNNGKAADGDFYDIHKYSWVPPLESDDDEDVPWSFKKIYEAYALDAGQERSVMNGEVGGTVIPLAGHMMVDRVLKFFKGHVKDGKFDKPWFVETFGDSVYNIIPDGNYTARKECFFLEMTTDEGMRVANARQIKRLYEMYRRQRPWMAGFATCYTRLFLWLSARTTGELEINPQSMEYIKASLQPLLAIFDGKLNRHIIAGQLYKERVYVMNDRLETEAGITVKVSLEQGGKIKYEFPEIQVGSLAPAEIKTFPLPINLPADFKTGHYKGILKVLAEGREKSSNWANYDFYVLNSADIKVSAKSAAVLYVPGSAAGTQSAKSVENVFNKLGIVYENIDDLNKISGDKVLFLPPLAWQDGASGTPFAQWLEAGGKVVCFEQDNMPFGIAGRVGACRRIGGFWTEIFDPTYPLFKGLERYDFFLWNGSRDNIMSKWFVTYGLFPLTGAAQAVIQQNNYKLGASVAEMKIGNGLCLMSQLEALDRFGMDSVATKFLVNLCDYTLNDWTGTNAAETKLAKESDGDARILEFDKTNAFFVDIRPYADMGFKDDVARDGKGGWTDQGPKKDMRNIPTGKVSLRGVDFDVIDPEKNNGKSCVVLAGPDYSPTGFLPKAVENIKIGKRVKKLYFLVAGAYIPVRQRKVAAFEIMYGAGVGHAQVLFSSITLDVIGGENIDDWMTENRRDLAEAVTGWIGASGAGYAVGSYLIEWVNPEPARVVVGINFRSTGVGVPILIAVTGEELK